MTPYSVPPSFPPPAPDQKPQTRRRTLLKAMTAMLVLLAGGVIFGACGDNAESGGDCTKCCACNCAEPCGEIGYQQNSCVNCDEQCPIWCQTEGCGFVSARSCDNERTCNCSCRCMECSGTESTGGGLCIGDCPDCAAFCRDICMGLGCGRVEQYIGCTS